MKLLDQLGMSIPVVQAPMAGVSTPELAAIVSDAGGLGSIALGASTVSDAREMIREIRGRTSRAFNANLFVHAAPKPDAARESAWTQALAPVFAEFGAEPPSRLRPVYGSFAADDDMLAMLVQEAPPVVSFHFGLPSPDRLKRLRDAGCLLLASVTSPSEAAEADALGVDALVAQGYEAGGHRGVFDPCAVDDKLGTLALTRLLATRSACPVIAAGAIMDGRGVRAALELGAVAAQLGTAFIACPESAADDAYRTALMGPGAEHTIVTHVISGRPARCLRNRFSSWEPTDAPPCPDYPIAYDAGKALAAAARARGEAGFSAHWAGQGAPLSRPLPAAALMARLRDEVEQGR